MSEPSRGSDSYVDPHALARRILAASGAIGPNGRLPTERRFAQDLGVSRAAVRQALSVMESGGLITRVVGRGTFLTGGTSPAPAGAPLADVSPSDVMAARSLIETHSMPLTVAHATPSEIAEMERCLRGGDDALTYPEFEEWDLALHRTLIAATHNTLLIHLYSSVDEARRGQLWGRLKLRSDSPERRDRYRSEHRSVVEAVRARDSALAVECMATHLASVTANLLGQSG